MSSAVPDSTADRRVLDVHWQLPSLPIRTLSFDAYTRKDYNNLRESRNCASYIRHSLFRGRGSCSKTTTKILTTGRSFTMSPSKFSMCECLSHAWVCFTGRWWRHCRSLHFLNLRITTLRCARNSKSLLLKRGSEENIWPRFLCSKWYIIINCGFHGTRKLNERWEQHVNVVNSYTPDYTRESRMLYKFMGGGYR